MMQAGGYYSLQLKQAENFEGKEKLKQITWHNNENFVEILKVHAVETTI